MTAEEIYKILAKLIGETKPIGETNIDNERFDNLKVMTELIDMLVNDVERVIPYCRNSQFSLKRAGEFANKYRASLNES